MPQRKSKLKLQKTPNRPYSFMCYKGLWGMHHPSARIALGSYRNNLVQLPLQMWEGQVCGRLWRAPQVGSGVWSLSFCLMLSFSTLKYCTFISFQNIPPTPLVGIRIWREFPLLHPVKQRLSKTGL